MPKLTRLYVKTALVYFVAALLIALLRAADDVLDLPRLVSTLRPVFFHLLVVGWLTQLIFGVMHWMFPKASRERPRGNEQLMWAVYYALNLGLLLRAVAEPALVLSDAVVWGWVLVASAALQWGAGTAFIINTWPRVKER